MAIKGSAVNIWVRKRGHACFRVDKAVDAAQRVAPLFTQGDDDYVIIRADVVTGCDFNLIVAIDAAESEWPTAVRLVEQAVGQSTAAVCVVTATFPEIPQQAHCFITEDEHRRYPLHEYSPPGRHPKSPGANPWG